MNTPARTTSTSTAGRSRWWRAAAALTVVGAGGLGTLAAAPMSPSGTAAAAAVPSEVCAVAPSVARTFTGNCGTNQPARSYTVQYVVRDRAGFDVAWALPPGVAASCGIQTPCVALGCHRGDDLCVVSARNDPQHDQYITVSATITLLTAGSATVASGAGTGASTGAAVGLWPLHLSSTAVIAASCGTPLCHAQ